LQDFAEGNEHNKCFSQSIQHIFIKDNITCCSCKRIAIIRPDDGRPDDGCGFISKTYGRVLDEYMLCWLIETFIVLSNATGMCRCKKVISMVTSGCSNTMCNHTVTELVANGYIPLKMYSPLAGYTE
jgi:hypothetical protein